MRRKVLPNLVLIGVSVAVTLVALELVTRLLFADITTTGDNTSYFARRWYAANTPIENRLGFRERDFAPAPAPDTYRIAVVGDSLTYGQGVQEAERLTNLVEERLNGRGQEERFEVLNFGQPGANYAEHARTLGLALERARPDFLLIQWYVNDVDERRKPRPWPLIPGLHRFLNPSSALYVVANGVWANLQLQLGLNPEPWTYYDLFKDPASPQAAAAREGLERMVGVAEAGGAPFALLLWPPTEQGTRPETFLLDQVLAACAAHGWRCVDLRPALAAAGGCQELCVNRLDRHPNAVANRAAAEAVLRELGEDWLAGARAKAAPPASG